MKCLQGLSHRELTQILLDPVKAEQLVKELGFILDEYERTGKLVEYHPSLKFYDQSH